MSVLYPHFLGSCNCLVLPTFLRLQSVKYTEKFQNRESVRGLNFIADSYLCAMPFVFVAIALRLNPLTPGPAVTGLDEH